MRGRVVAAGAAVVLALAGTWAGLDVVDAVPGPLTTTPPPTAPPLPTAPAADPAAQGPAAPVLEAAAGDAPVPDAAVLEGVLGPLLADPALGPRVSAAVADAATGQALLTRDADASRAPASTTKVLTAVAALDALGPGSRATTRVVAGATADEVVLVAGGDVLLDGAAGDPALVDGRAGLGDLADAAAAALLARGRTSVALRLDDGLFTGPAVSPGWGSGDVAAGYVAPISPLAVHEGRLRDVPNPPREPDPALAAAAQLAEGLSARGVRVVGDVARAAAPPGAEELAAVASATTAEQVELMLATSDNTLAEVLARRVALASGRPGTFDDASAAVVERVAALGADVTGVRLQGGSGLGRETRLTAAVLRDLLVLAASDAPGAAHLRAAVTGLAVCGATGTLSLRCDSAPAAAGGGVVRAKTGTLTGVSSLAGYAQTVDGRLLAFAVLADAVPPGGTPAAQEVLDRVGAALASCGCR
ncbi:D-alanyl-D-alanine carboxypeptidase/D-alanyl-D-alanine endopeptidase [Kineococcus terrestris]|uniref:D-alanyl-D-alanine carboxypeptidase/D-alanyl-D-alanine endopeptidase n=1 Tax=Kineococcus terrestris TaxID=2044856 RepID=UPI0034DAE2FB